VQNKIKNWIQWKEDIDSPIMWLYGGAGAGKSTIARTIAEWCEEERILLSSFFFWRSDQTRNHIKTFLATVAYNITQFIPETRQLIELAVEDDRHIFSRNLESQFIKLVYEPFMKVSQTVTTLVIFRMSSLSMGWMNA
jgi:replication-associated recombination protein RarA